ncbi:unnamed protein product [Alternaria alternata]
MRNLLKRFVPHSTRTRKMQSNNTTEDHQLIRTVLDESLVPVAEAFENTEDGNLPEDVIKLGRVFIEFRAIFESKEIRLSTINGDSRAEMARCARPILDYLKNHQDNAVLPGRQLEVSATYLYDFAQKHIAASGEETERLRQAYEGLMEDLKDKQKPTNTQHNKMGDGSISNQFVARNQYNNSGHGFQMIGGNIRSFNQADGQGRNPSA